MGPEWNYLKGGFTLKSKNGTFLLNTSAGFVFTTFSSFAPVKMS